MTAVELTRSAGVRAVLRSRYPQFVLLVALLATYVFAIVAGLIGTPVGSSNFGIVFVWIAWWAVLILLAVPLLGRGWCAVCPIPLPGEWLQRGAVLGPSGRPAARRRRWPRALRSIWLQNGSFLLLASSSAVLLTTPAATAAVLGAMLLVAIGMSLAFERRSFCRYLCPVGGFIGLYSQAAPLELRVRDRSVCAACVGKPCYNGSPSGYGCPWDVFPGGLTKNTYCGLCLECARTCPSDNIAVNVRAFGADLERPTGRLDEAFKAFVMLGSAIVYSAVLLGPWGALKSAAYHIGTPAWFLFAVAMLVFVGGLLPGLFALCASPTLPLRAWRTRFARLATALIPLGLAAWIAFSLSFALTNGSYVLAAFSDPLGFGWNLFGTAGIAWQPMLSSLLAPSQTLVLVGGVIWSARTAQRAGAAAGISPLPAVIFCSLTAILLMWLLL